MPSGQALQRLHAGNERHVKRLSGDAQAPGDPTRAAFPFALVVGCFEPDAAGEHLFAEKPGAVQCVRTAGPSLGADTMAAIEYAVLVQNVGVVLVLGHSGCGVLTAAADARAAGPVPLPGDLAAWVPLAAAGTRLGKPASGHVRALRAALRNADSLLTLTRSGQVKIAGGVLDPATGAIEFLPDEPDDTGPEMIVAIFSGAARKGVWQPRRNLSVLTLFGGAELDLTQAVFTDNVCEINVFCLFGGIEITVPDGTTVRNECVAVFGGSDTKTMPPTPGAPTVIVKGFIGFGGVEVRGLSKKQRKRRDCGS